VVFPDRYNTAEAVAGMRRMTFCDAWRRTYVNVKALKAARLPHRNPRKAKGEERER